MKTGSICSGRSLITGEASKIGTFRPMTSVRAAGFSSNLRKGTIFGKFNVDFSAVCQSNGEIRTADSTVPPLEQKSEGSPESQMQEMEKKVTQIFLFQVHQFSSLISKSHSVSSTVQSIT